jgi:hypothetical protein
MHFLFRLFEQFGLPTCSFGFAALVVKPQPLFPLGVCLVPRKGVKKAVLALFGK